jgi:cytochrome c nitrite reductase small subunit
MTGETNETSPTVPGRGNADTKRGNSVDPETRSNTDQAKQRRPLARSLPLLIAVALGAFGGIGAFTFGYGEGASYLTNDPQACANCHVMQGHYNSWVNSSHSNVAVCNDCHLPHNFVGKWITKADNGFFHSLAFTTNDFHEPIQIKPRNRRVTQNACLHCHADVAHNMLPADTGGDMLSCVHCHADVGHAGE